ncbi:MAG: hypothetical protein CSA21_08050, partial [Deltaproteobacteria bacterium]
LEEVLPGGKGAFALTADISGTELRPAGRVTFTGSNLGWHDLSLQQIKGAFQLQRGLQGEGGGKLEAAGLRYKETVLQQLLLQLAGSADRHRLDLHIDKGTVGGKPFAAAVTAVGGISDSPWQWQGKIVSGQFDFQPYGSWQQQHDALLHIEKGNISVENFTVSSKLATLAASASAIRQQGPWQWQAHAQIAGMELTEWQKMLQLPVGIAGEFSAELSVRGEDMVPIAANFLAEFPDTVVTMENIFSQGESVRFSNGRVIGSLQDGLLTANGGFTESGGGSLKWRLQAGEEGLPFAGGLPLTGTILCGDLNVDLLGSFVDYSQPSGRLHADLLLAGTLIRPKLSGKISLAGEVGILSQGISLHNPEITLDADPEQTRLHGVAASGDGFINVDGRLQYGERGVSADFTINGHNFLAVDLPEYSFAVDPAMRFTGDLDKGRLSGKVTVVSGLIEPHYLPDTVSVSDDVIMINKGEQAADSRWQFSMDMAVDLGEDISINGYGLSGRLGGDLQVKMTPEGLLTGTGIVDLRNGKFTMYGRSLDITRGKIIFSGGAMDNPGVDIRAE